MAEGTTHPRRRTWRRVAGVGLAAAAGGALATALVPCSTAGLDPHPNPTQSYDEALAKFDQLQALDGEEVNPICRSQLLVHGHQTDWAVVLLHGITNCPYQFQQLAPLFYERGYNVLIPRMPYNGYLDTEGNALRHLTAKALAEYGDTAVDIARGLGTRTVVIGLSASGVVTAWLAQFRADVDRAVIMAPALGLWILQGTDPIFTNLFLRLPNAERRRERNAVEPVQNYTRQQSKAAGEWLRLAAAVRRAARVAAPQAGSIVVISNANDRVISNKATAKLVQIWQQHGYPVEVYDFPADLKLTHDLIDPQQPAQRVDIVYPKLMELALPHAEA